MITDRMRALRLAAVAAVAVAVWAEGPLEVRPRAQAPDDDMSGSSVTRASVSWVRVPVHVMNESGIPRAGLTRADFAVWEDGVPQTVLSAGEEETPLSLTIVFDASSSMKDRMARARAVLPELFQLALPGDEYALLRFGTDAQLMLPYTGEIAEVERTAAKMELTTWTALYDAVYLGLRQGRHAVNPRRAMLVISDGGDNNSRYSASELLAYAREAETAVFAVAIDTTPRQAEPLRRLAEATGGAVEMVRDINELGPALARMSRRLRSEYVLHYNSTHGERDGRYRKVEVKLTGAAAAERGWKLAWRRGYYSAAD